MFSADAVGEGHGSFWYPEDAVVSAGGASGVRVAQPLPQQERLHLKHVWQLISWSARKTRLWLRFRSPSAVDFSAELSWHLETFP